MANDAKKIERSFDYGRLLEEVHAHLVVMGMDAKRDIEKMGFLAILEDCSRNNVILEVRFNNHPSGTGGPKND